MAIFTGPTVMPTAAAAVNRRTFGDIKAELARPYNPDDDTTLAMAGDAWNSAIRAYNRYNWPWEVLTTTITLSSGTATYALPQAFKAPLSAYRNNTSSGNYRLNYMPYESFINLQNTSTTSATVTVYTLKNVFETGQVTFYPTPNSSDTVDVHYYRRTPTLQRDGEPVEAPEEAIEAMMDWARYLMVTYKLADQSDRIGIAYRQAQESRAELVAQVIDRGDNYGIA